jgi:hypothetical protein
MRMSLYPAFGMIDLQQRQRPARGRSLRLGASERCRQSQQTTRA